MTWNEIPAATLGGTIGANDYYSWNDYIVNNVKELKGQNGTITIGDDVSFDNDGNFGIRKSGNLIQLQFDSGDYIEYNRLLDQFNFYQAGTVMAILDENRWQWPKTGFYSLDNGIGANRHIESATSAAESMLNAINEDAFTFVKAFSAAPNLVPALQHTNTATYEDCGVIIKTGTLTTTGVTLQKYNFSAVTRAVLTSYFMAEGPN